MKQYNPFDNLENINDNIDEQTIYENTGVSYKNIKSKVFDNIHSKQKKGLKKLSVVGKVVIIAATLLLSTTAYAFGSFNDAFGYVFSGEYEDGWYSGGNAVIECNDDSLNVELLGVTGGNNSEAYIAYKITKKDGTAFEFTKNGIDGCVVDLGVENSEIDEPLISNIIGGATSWGSFSRMVDEKTIVSYINYTSDLPIRGQKINVDFDDITYWHIDKRLGEYINHNSYKDEQVEVIEECKPVNGSTDSIDYQISVDLRVAELYNEYGLNEAVEIIPENGYDVQEDDGIRVEKDIEVRQENGKDCICLVTTTYDDKGWENDVNKKASELAKQYDLNENQKIVPYFQDEKYIGDLSADYEFCIITSVNYDVKIKSELYLNYREKTNKYTVDSTIAENIIDIESAKDFKNGKMIISPLSIRFKFKYNDPKHAERNANFNTHDSETEDEIIDLIRMNDGKEYQLFESGSGSSGDTDGNVKETRDYVIAEMNDDDDEPQLAVIDIENIKEVVINGETISVS